MWGRLATCAAVGYRRRSTAKAAGADCQSAAGYQPAPQNLVRQPTPAQFFMGFRGPKAHSNRPRKTMVCPTGLQLFEELVEGAAGVVGVARRGWAGIGGGCGRRRRRARRAVARHGYPRVKGDADVGLILHGDAHRDGLHALKPHGGLEMRALFTTVKLRVALRAVAGQIGFRGQGSGAVETPRRGDMLHQPGETGAGHVQGRTRALRFGPVVAKALALARVHVPVLSVFAIAIHGESYSVLMGEKTLPTYDQNSSHQPSNADHSHDAARQTPRQRLGRGITRGA